MTTRRPPTHLMLRPRIAPLAAALLLLTHGRIAGISGVIGSLLPPVPSDRGWRLAFVAGLAGQALGWYHAGAGAGFIGSVIGAVVLLFAYGKLKGSAT